MKILICDPIHHEAIDYLKKSAVDVIYLPEITPDQLIKKIAGFEALVVRGRTKITSEVIQQGINLKIIGRVGTGVDNIDIDEAKRKNILIINAPGANAQAVAELTLGLMLSLLRKIPKADYSIKKGEWAKKELKGEELHGKKVGIIGFGNIGRRVARAVEAFGASVLTHNRDNDENNLNILLKESDIVSIHCVLTEETKSMINADRLSLMKKSAYLINCARAEIIDEEALYTALETNQIKGAALDVFWDEPLPKNSPWLNLDNVILSPHIGGQTIEASQSASIIIAENLVKYFLGKTPDFIV